MLYNISDEKDVEPRSCKSKESSLRRISLTIFGKANLIKEDYENIDSRYFGCINKSQILAIVIWY